MKDTFLSRFTPSLMSHETLEAIFIQREKLAQDLVERIRDSALTPAKHHTLLIGPRGIGKTHLVALVYHRVKALEELHDGLRIAWLREEEWGITSFMDLLLRILRALEEEHPDADLAEALEAIYALASPEDAERAAAELLTTYVGDRTLLILVENLDDIFSGLGTEGQQQLRAYLQNHPFATLLATAQSLFNGVSVRTSPFYGFFNVHHLKPFSLDEAVQLLTTIARLEGDDDLAGFIQTPKGRARIRAVHHLAGGNPRVYVILSQFLTRDTLDALVEPFMSMLDDMTPYYQARMQWLSPQQRKIVEYLIERRSAVPVKDIAGRTFATHQTISSQLRTLRDMGYVRSISVGRESRYELREPLMRMCVEVKKHRGKPIRLFVDFLRLWYTQSELEQRLERFALKDDVEHEYVLQALRADSDQSESPLLKSCRRDYNRYIEAKDFDRALEVVEEMVEIRGFAEDWYLQGQILGKLGRHENAVVSFEKAITLKPGYAEAWTDRGVALGRLERYDEALASLEKAVALEPKHASAWYNHACALGHLERYEEALSSCEKAISMELESSLSNLAKELQSLLLEVLDAKKELVDVEVKLTEQWDKFFVVLDNILKREEGEKDAVYLAKYVSDLVFSSAEVSVNRVGAFVAIYEKHDLLSSLAVGFQRSLSDLENIEDATLHECQEAWQEAAGGYDEFQLPLRLLDAVIEYRTTQDPRILLDFPIEERDLLRQLLEIEDFEGTQ